MAVDLAGFRLWFCLPGRTPILRGGLATAHRMPTGALRRWRTGRVAPGITTNAEVPTRAAARDNQPIPEAACGRMTVAARPVDGDCDGVGGAQVHRQLRRILGSFGVYFALAMAARPAAGGLHPDHVQRRSRQRRFIQASRCR